MIVIVFPHDWPHKSPTLLQLLEDINRERLEYELYLHINAKKIESSIKRADLASLFFSIHLT